MKEDKPGNAPLYILHTPSSFKLSFGQLKPFPRGADARIMVVSDLDGTMFGDVSSPDAFDSSYRFLQYWESTQVGEGKGRGTGGGERKRGGGVWFGYSGCVDLGAKGRMTAATASLLYWESTQVRGKEKGVEGRDRLLKVCWSGDGRAGTV